MYQRNKCETREFLLRQTVDFVEVFAKYFSELNIRGTLKP